MQLLIVATGDLFGHLFHVPSITLVQAMEIASGSLFDGARPPLEARQVGGEMGVEVGQGRLDQMRNAFGILRPSYLSTASVNSIKTMPCILPHDAFRRLRGYLTK